ncbi:DUF1772 domain-containing protein [Niabella drilacis]|uniref:Uncharacterized membrane protein n=1 Tax=Niabella drilacis (strain DSM 25811 / CCM 8410 / CCUG 62505 / LMG 26954 / E90) TaxID=1285928 RepID=A0A1G6WU68_NIADE|nr:DUF1772 domain-containing protein [Niabella drilacis]SDD69193.1 Uncharacterized membrane protein [Niabella drilacis]
MKKFWWFCSLILVMLVTGVFWGTWFTLTRSLETFPPDHFIRIGQTIIDNVATPMRILMPATLLLQLLLCISFWKQRPVFYFFAVSFIFMIISLLITLIVEVPIDNQIRTWTAATIPDSWTALRATWKQFHCFRTLTSILSFVSLAVPVLFRHRSRSAYR